MRDVKFSARFIVVKVESSGLRLFTFILMWRMDLGHDPFKIVINKCISNLIYISRFLKNDRISDGIISQDLRYQQVLHYK